jgi:chromosome segregation ATPase
MGECDTVGCECEVCGERIEVLQRKVAELETALFAQHNGMEMSPAQAEMYKSRIAELEQEKAELEQQVKTAFAWNDRVTEMAQRIADTAMDDGEQQARHAVDSLWLIECRVLPRLEQEKAEWMHAAYAAMGHATESMVNDIAITPKAALERCLKIGQEKAGDE